MPFYCVPRPTSCGGGGTPRGGVQCKKIYTRIGTVN